MNYRQIRELIKKPNTWFELQEDYEYDMQFLKVVIPKGTKMQYVHPALQQWRFRFEDPIHPFGMEVGLGRSRLLKMKLKELSEFKEDPYKGGKQ